MFRPLCRVPAKQVHLFFIKLKFFLLQYGNDPSLSLRPGACLTHTKTFNIKLISNAKKVKICTACASRQNPPSSVHPPHPRSYHTR